jgi:hypothetical protein
VPSSRAACPLNISSVSCNRKVTASDTGVGVSVARGGSGLGVGDVGRGGMTVEVDVTSIEGPTVAEGARDTVATGLALPVPAGAGEGLTELTAVGTRLARESPSSVVAVQPTSSAPRSKPAAARPTRFTTTPCPSSTHATHEAGAAHQAGPSSGTRQRRNRRARCSGCYETP